MLVALNHKDGKLLSLSFIGDPTYATYENAHAPVQTLDMESMADMTANEERIRLAFEAAQLKKDAEDLENIVNPKEKKPAAEGEESEGGDEEESEDEGSEEEGDLDDEGSDDEGL